MLPKDPVMLLSVVNTKLRDEYPSLAVLCDELDVSEQTLCQTLAALDYYYDAQHNRFVSLPRRGE